MTLVSSLIVQAYRECNMLPLGIVPTANQTAEALQLHNGLLSAIFGGDAGEPLQDWILGNYDRDSDLDPPIVVDDRLVNPPLNRRLIAINDAAITIYLSRRPQDGARYGISDPFGRLAAFPVTLDANGRTIETTPTMTLNTNGMHQEWIYRADLSNWQKILSVAATDDNPFPAAFDNMFIILLAMRLSPRYGRALTQESLNILKQNKREFIARYLQSQPLEADDSLSWPFMSRQSYGQGRNFSSNDSFNRGWRS